MSHIANVIGDRIRSLRQAKSWTQEDLAHKASINRSYLGELERGEKVARIDVLEKIANAFDISLSELFEFIPNLLDNNNLTLAQLVNKLYALTKEDQEAILDLFDIVFNRIGKSK